MATSFGGGHRVICPPLAKKSKVARAIRSRSPRLDSEDLPSAVGTLCTERILPRVQGGGGGAGARCVSQGRNRRPTSLRTGHPARDHRGALGGSPAAPSVCPPCHSLPSLPRKTPRPLPRKEKRGRGKVSTDQGGSDHKAKHPAMPRMVPGQRTPRLDAARSTPLPDI